VLDNGCFYLIRHWIHHQLAQICLNGICCLVKTSHWRDPGLGFRVCFLWIWCTNEFHFKLMIYSQWEFISGLHYCNSTIKVQALRFHYISFLCHHLCRIVSSFTIFLFPHCLHHVSKESTAVIPQLFIRSRLNGWCTLKNNFLYLFFLFASIYWTTSMLLQSCTFVAGRLQNHLYACS